MTLTDSNGRSIERPSAFQIEQAIRTLPGGLDSFLILSTDEMTYIQTAGGGTEPLLLEYQEGALENHFRATDEDVTEELVIRVFQAYAAGRPDWRSIVRWDKEDRASPLQSNQNSRAMIVAVILVLIGSCLVFWLLGGS